MRLSSLREGILLALDQIRVNRFRSALTILGIVVGVTTVMAMSALVVGIRSSVIDQIQAAGPRNFILARFDFDDARRADSGRNWWDNPRITPLEAGRIERLPGVRRAVVDFDLSGTFEVDRDRVEGVQISADGHGWSEFTRGAFVAGRDFLESDVRASRPVVVISSALAETLFGALDPVGRTVRIDGSSFRIIGVFELEGNIFASIVRHIAIMPYTAALKHLNASEEFLSVLVVTDDEATQDQAMDQVVTLLRGSRGLRPGEPNDFAIIRQDQLLDTFNRLTGVFFIVMIALSSVGLLVGGVGVVAIMMIAVTERTREIGIRKAVGARRREILWQFLVESATLTLVGGAIGMAVGGALAFLVHALTPIPASVPLWAVFAALLMAALAGVGFGIWPA
ncbi:MAG: ABC transporter permease, partial [Gemmatimonadota bacterium]